MYWVAQLPHTNDLLHNVSFVFHPSPTINSLSYTRHTQEGQACSNNSVVQSKTPGLHVLIGSQSHNFAHKQLEHILPNITSLHNIAHTFIFRAHFVFFIWTNAVQKCLDRGGPS